jgi:hypothetical protein
MKSQLSSTSIDSRFVLRVAKMAPLTFSKRIDNFMFTEFRGFAASAASENRRMTSVSQSTLQCKTELPSRLRLHASTICHRQTWFRVDLETAPSATELEKAKINNDVTDGSNLHQPSASVSVLMIPSVSIVLSPPLSSGSI